MKLSDDGHKGTNMDCQKVEDQEMIERYLTEQLSQQESEALEQHYLGCRRCFSELQMRHAAAIELSARRFQPRPVRSWWMPVSRPWAVASTAVALIVLGGILYNRPWEQVREPEQQIATVQQPNEAVLEKLAAINEIPPYIPGLIRGGETDPALIKFQEGMTLYSMQKYSEAIVPLSEAVRLDPERTIASFYLGVSYLASSDPDRAIEQLAKVTAQQNPYYEEGHWFLAKAYLKKRDFQSARRELQKVQSLQGQLSAAAQDLLTQIRNF